ncbi:MAG: ribosome-associated translation inhibitor RaiA [Eubacteriales bacterium]|nr:ribosome-associated translation inhibitor RaiA [Eubacteriales bacterium]MDY3332463.1 ribosome-associated translation inhibitor RaiA [Gallibacter sp.]
MKVIISSKNVKTNDYLKDIIEKKLEKLDKYFSDDITAKVMLSAESKAEKMEVTIRVTGHVFRAEGKADKIYNCVDKVVDKLAIQMSKFKNKLTNKKGGDAIKFEEWPELPLAKDESYELKIVKDKQFHLDPLTIEDAIIKMELVDHNFYIFLNSDTKDVNVVYKRDDGDYGLIETKY